MSESNEIYQVAAAITEANKQTYHFPLTGAYLCADCDMVTNNSQACPSCTSKSLIPLSGVVNRTN
jgi:hypothetical protein